MSSIIFVNALLILVLLALLRQLIWCVRWLWCYYHGKDVPDPIAFLPHRSGRGFEQRVEDAADKQEE